MVSTCQRRLVIAPHTGLSGERDGAWPSEDAQGIQQGGHGFPKMGMNHGKRHAHSDNVKTSNLQNSAVFLAHERAKVTGLAAWF